jgi:hypothetical protein
MPNSGHAQAPSIDRGPGESSARAQSNSPLGLPAGTAMNAMDVKGHTNRSPMSPA